MMLSEELKYFFAKEFKYNLLSIETFIEMMQRRSVVTKIIFKAFRDFDLAEREEDLRVKKFIVNTNSSISKRLEVKDLSQRIQFFSKQILEVNSLLDEAKAFDVTGKSYHESQLLKKLVAHQISMIKIDVLPLLKILDEIEIQFNRSIDDSEDLIEKLGLVVFLDFKEIRKILSNLYTEKKVSAIENKLKLCNDQLFNYYRILILKISLLTDNIRNPIREIIKYIITNDSKNY